MTGHRTPSPIIPVRTNSRRRLLLTLLRHQPVSRVRLARLTGLSTATVTNLTAPLVQSGVVVEVGTDTLAQSQGAGRPPTALALVPDSRLALGIHIGVRRSVVALGALDAQVLAHQTVPHEGEGQGEATIRRLAQAVRDLLAQHGLNSSDRIVGVGVGASGLVDSVAGVNRWAPALGWRDVPIRAILERELGLPVAVENNVRCMALAEYLFGAGQDRRVLAFVYARMGVGAGLIIDGHIYRGASQAAGEIGHWTILPRGGEVCRCGNTGCLETLISERVLVRKGRELAPEVLDGAEDPLRALFDAAREGHPALQAMLEEHADYLGIALANLVNGLNPEMILLGGLLHQGYDLFRPTVARSMQQRTFAGVGLEADLRPATFGPLSGPVGALSLALDRFFYTQSRPSSVTVSEA